MTIIKKGKPGRPPVTRENNPIYQRMNTRGITFESLSERVGLPLTTVRDLVSKADGGTLRLTQFEKFLKILHEVGLDIKDGGIK
jgi:hypothetical protein